MGSTSIRDALGYPTHTAGQYDPRFLGEPGQWWQSWSSSGVTRPPCTESSHAPGTSTWQTEDTDQLQWLPSMGMWAKQAVLVPGKVFAMSRAALLHHHSKAGCYYCPSHPAGLIPAHPSHPQGEHHNQGTLLCLTQPHLAPATVCWQLVAPVLLSLVVVTHLRVSTLQMGMEMLLLCCCTERSVFGCK